MFRAVIAVGFGSCLGGICRFGLSRAVQAVAPAGFPYATFVVNLLGCLLIGIVAGVLSRMQLQEEWRLVLAVGFCGGFTTFSTFSSENLALLQSGNILTCILYAAVSVVLGVIAVWVGLTAVK